VAERVRARFSRAAVLLIGSYSRGDFNLWSDIDLLLVFDEDLPKSPLKRHEMVVELLEPNMEAHIITLKELHTLLRKGNPYLIRALKEATPILDPLGVSAFMKPDKMGGG
jgi:hypothetical protein